LLIRDQKTITFVSTTAMHQIFPLYAEMLSAAEDILVHWPEDLTVHDRKTLHTKFQPGQLWLWQLRPTGTWLVRWDEDPNAGSKDSMLEILINSGCRGNWLDAQWFILHCQEIRNGQPYGTMTMPFDVHYLQTFLPRPKPQPTLPGERRYAYAGQ